MVGWDGTRCGEGWQCGACRMEGGNGKVTERLRATVAVAKAWMTTPSCWDWTMQRCQLHVFSTLPS